MCKCAYAQLLSCWCRELVCQAQLQRCWTIATVPCTVVALPAALLCACCEGLLHLVLSAVAVFPHTCLALPCVLNKPNSRQLHFPRGTAATSSCPTALLLVMVAAEDCSPLLFGHCAPLHLFFYICSFGGSDSCTSASNRLHLLWRLPGTLHQPGCC
jgi:hypothetical protein